MSKLSSQWNTKINQEITVLQQKLILEFALYECSIWKHCFIYKIIGILFALEAFSIAVTSFKIFKFLFLLPFQLEASV